MTEEYGSVAGEEIRSPIEVRKEEIESTFSFDGYQVVRKELFAHLRDPAVVVRNGSITFNQSCINGLEGVVYVQLMFNDELQRLVVRACDENEKDALRWCVDRPEKRKSRKMTCKKFTDLVYDVMGWTKSCRYKILGYLIPFEGEMLYVFDFKVAEIFIEGKNTEETAQENEQQPAENKPLEIEGVAEPPKNTRKGFYRDDIAGTFGVPIEEHRQSTDVREMDGFVSMGMLTGE